MELRADEFYLGVSYRKPDQGSYPRPEVQGFYLTAHFCNGGDVHNYSHKAPGTLLSQQQAIDIASLVAPMVPYGKLLPADLAGALQRDRADRTRLVAEMKERFAQLGARIALLEKDLQ